MAGDSDVQGEKTLLSEYSFHTPLYIELRKRFQQISGAHSACKTDEEFIDMVASRQVCIARFPVDAPTRLFLSQLAYLSVEGTYADDMMVSHASKTWIWDMGIICLAVQDKRSSLQTANFVTVMRDINKLPPALRGERIQFLDALDDSLRFRVAGAVLCVCLLYTSDAADD